MLFGAIIGDVIGSTYEFKKIKDWNAELFPSGSSYTDDTVMTIAVADALMEWKSSGGDLSRLFVKHMKRYGALYPSPMGGYGRQFSAWLESGEPQPYDSYGNGAAMRVSPCGLIAGSLQEALELAKCSSEVSHRHPEAIRGAQAASAAVYLAANGASREKIHSYIQENYYPLDKTLNEIRPYYCFNDTCQGSVPESIQAFLESSDYETAIRNVLSLGGDTDTMGAIAGGIAGAFYTRDGVPESVRELWSTAAHFLPDELIDRVYEFHAFCEKYKGHPDRAEQYRSQRQKQKAQEEETQRNLLSDVPVVRKLLVFHGKVQGVGFRRNALLLATRLKATGWVRRDIAQTVTMEIQSTPARIAYLTDQISRIPSVRIEQIDDLSGKGKSLPVVLSELDFRVRPNQQYETVPGLVK